MPAKSMPPEVQRVENYVKLANGEFKTICSTLRAGGKYTVAELGNVAELFEKAARFAREAKPSAK
jgi:hypothetical protein